MRKRRKKHRPIVEQLAFDLDVVTPAPPVVPVEAMTVGYFVAVKMSSGYWWLTVAPPKHSYLIEERTPQLWWKTCCRDEYTLHGWCPDGVHVVTDRDDAESPPRLFELRSTADRWLRSFNEAYQNWRMEAYV